MILFIIEENNNNKHLGRIALTTAEDLGGIAPESYGSRESKAVEIQSLNTHIFYNIIIIIRVTSIRTFEYLTSSYNIVGKTLASL